MANANFGEQLNACPMMDKNWAKSLFTMEVADASNALGEAINNALQSRFSPIDYFRLSEVARALVVGVHNRWTRLYASDIAAFNEDVGLWHLLWKFYAVNLRPLHERDPELSEQKAALLQRALFVGKELRLTYALARKPFPDALWKEIYAYFRFAEALECLYDNISDKLISTENRVNCYLMTMYPLLLDLAKPESLSNQQILWINRWLLRLGRKVKPVLEKEARDGLFLEIDLTQSKGALLVPGAKSPQELTRYASLAEVARALNRRRRHLIAGETPERLLLGKDINKNQALQLIIYLETVWCHFPEIPETKDTFSWEAVD
ncbi:MAG: hypothetical protein LBG61_03430 [Burkholderiales bacterium]|nr:hypothetical protein [Burkholderiales bacterium]